MSLSSRNLRGGHVATKRNTEDSLPAVRGSDQGAGPRPRFASHLPQVWTGLRVVREHDAQPRGTGGEANGPRVRGQSIRQAALAGPSRQSRRAPATSSSTRSASCIPSEGGKFTYPGDGSGAAGCCTRGWRWICPARSGARQPPSRACSPGSLTSRGQACRRVNGSAYPARDEVASGPDEFRRSSSSTAEASARCRSQVAGYGRPDDARPPAETEAAAAERGGGRVPAVQYADACATGKDRSNHPVS